MSKPMQKPNLMGQVKSPQQGKLQIVNVLYGHHGSGKTYSYYGTNKRAGDIVTPEVTHPKSGKTYKTLAVVQNTHDVGTASGQATVNYLTGNMTRGELNKFSEGNPNLVGKYLAGKDRQIKTIGKTDQRSLPGYYSGWDKDADAAYEMKLEAQKADIPKMERLSLMREINHMRRQDIKNHHKKGE